MGCWWLINLGGSIKRSSVLFVVYLSWDTRVTRLLSWWCDALMTWAVCGEKAQLVYPVHFEFKNADRPFWVMLSALHLIHLKLINFKVNQPEAYFEHPFSDWRWCHLYLRSVGDDSITTAPALRCEVGVGWDGPLEGTVWGSHVSISHISLVLS